jgi:hypothetical protein
VLPIPDTEVPMRQRPVGEPWDDQLLDRAEARLPEALAYWPHNPEACAQALLGNAADGWSSGAPSAIRRECRRPPRAVRVWLGSVLITLGRRLLRPMSEPVAPA